MKERGMVNSEARKRRAEVKPKGMITSEARKRDTVTALLPMHEGVVIQIKDYRVEPMNDWVERFKK